jgi:hypothetical protein
VATPPPGKRSKASKLRKQLANGEISDVDRLWLHEYEEQTNGSGDWGKSASRTRVHRTETVEEDKAAEGTGSGAAHAAGLALMAKEEGRRLDSLTVNAIAALHEAVDVYKSVATTLLERTKVLEETHVEMLQSIRAEFLSRMETEADLLAKEREDHPDEAKSMAMAMIAQHLGIDLSKFSGAPSPNGAPKKKT